MVFSWYLENFTVYCTRITFSTGFTFYIFFVGTIGHVAHGKSTVVKALSGVQVIFISLSFFCDYSKIIEVFCWCGYYLHVADFASNFLTM